MLAEVNNILIQPNTGLLNLTLLLDLTMDLKLKQEWHKTKTRETDVKEISI